MRIELSGVTLAANGTRLLDDVCLAVPDGAFAAVLGPSGAGKSTLLRVIAGLAEQDASSVSFDGVPQDGVAPHRRGVAMVFQDARLFPTMNARDNVAFPLKARGVGRPERRRRADAMLADVQLAGFGDRRCGELSGGQRQRVALARALVASPRAVLLDEPFSGLDEALRDDMRRLVLDLHRRLGTTTLMVTHDPLEALTMSDLVVHLVGGRVVQRGTPAELLERPAVPEVLAGLGSLEGTVAGGAFSCGSLHVPAPGLPDGPAVLVRLADGTVRICPL